MASYPNGTYSPRTKENRSGVVYDANKKTVVFAEDISNLDAEVEALETHTRIPTSQPAEPVTGEAWFDTANNLLYIYNGAAWKSCLLS